MQERASHEEDPNAPFRPSPTPPDVHIQILNPLQLYLW